MALKSQPISCNKQSENLYPFAEKRLKGNTLYKRHIPIYLIKYPQREKEGYPILFISVFRMLLPCSIQLMTKKKTSNAGSALN